jgi:hypothetical protein
MHRILYWAAIATAAYALTVIIWPHLWRRDLIWLGGVWSLLMLIAGDRRSWQLTISQIQVETQQDRLRMTPGETLLAFASLGLTIYGIGDFF